MGLKMYVAKKIFFALIAYFIAITIVFFLYHIMPGNPVDLFAMDPRMPPEVRDHMIELWGLDKPILEQYFIYLGNLFRGELGDSFFYKTSVTSLIGEALPWTLLLLGTSFIINAIVGIFLGAYVAWRRGSNLDTGFVLTYNIYNAFPLFFVGLLFLSIFGYQAKIKGWAIWFPVFGAMDPGAFDGGIFPGILDVLHHLALPLLVLTLFGILSWSWFMRGNLIGVLTEDYVQTARAKGLNDNKVLYKHSMRNAILPVITNIGMSIGGLIGGSILIETVFGYPGTGLLIYNALLEKDYNLVQGAFIIIAGITLLGLLISEILYAIIDPRIRTS